ncbi:MAG: cupin domain-containing protein [Actinomycetota bacterium]|nr:cupin domain-containing protein [Actinomycetota bacterium]
MATGANGGPAMADGLPRTIENPISGERVTFLATADETRGEYTRVRTEISAGGRGTVLHYHLAYTEAFTVLEGTLNMCVGRGNKRVLGKGESAFVPLRTPHRFWNPSAELAVFEVEVRPSRDFEKALRAQCGLVADGRTNDKAVPRNLFELALIYELSESYIAGLPLFLQTRLFGALARIARWRGYDPEFSQYTRPSPRRDR